MRVLRPDYIFIWSIGIVLLFGVLMLMSATAPLMQDNSYFFVKRQIIFGILPGAVLFAFLSYHPYKNLQRWRWFGLIAALLLLVVVLVPGIGQTNNTFARRWISIFGMSFQPVEFAKLALIIFFADWLSKLRATERAVWQTGFLPLVLVLGIVGFLVYKQPDIGSFIVIAAIVCLMYVAGGGRWKYIGIMAGGAAVALGALFFFAPYSHIAQRINVFFHSELDPLGAGWQINQSYIAVGTGGWWGVGWGQSRQKFQYLPQVQSDAIFSIIAEELGFIWSGAFILFLLWIFFRMMRISRGAPDEFGKLVVLGMAVWMVGQSFLNVGAMTGAFPLTGVPLPLVSHGSTAVIMLLAGMGIVVNISRYAHRQ